MSLQDCGRYRGHEIHTYIASHILNTKKNKFLFLVDKSCMICVYGTLLLKS